MQSVGCAKPLIRRCTYGIVLLIVAMLSVSTATRAQEVDWIAWEATLTLEQRQTIQEGLVWEGHYFGLLDGDFGPLTRRAIESLQGQLGAVPTGYLRWNEVDFLFLTVEHMRAMTGFGSWFDPATGIGIAIPHAHFGGQPEVNTFPTLISTSLNDLAGRAAVNLVRIEYADDLMWQMFHESVSENASGAQMTIEYDFFRSGRMSLWASLGNEKRYVFGLRRNQSARAMVWVIDAAHAETYTPFAILASSYFGAFGSGVDLVEAPLPPAPDGYAPPKPPSVASVPSLMPGPPSIDGYPPSRPPAADGAPRSPPPPPASRSPSVLGYGSGFFVNHSGQIVTNAHVISECDAVRVSQHDWPPRLATVVAVDHISDLAVVDGNQSETAFLPLRAIPRPQIGEPVMVAGFPLSDILGSSLSVTTGTLSALAGMDGDTQHYRISAPIQPGNSGGPVIDAFGSLIGVTVARLDETLVGTQVQNVNFAIKSSALQAFLESYGIDYSFNETADELGQVTLGTLAGRVAVFVECLQVH